MTIDGLGVFDADADGLNDSHQVGLWGATETLLASGVVAAGAVGTDPSLSGAGGYTYTSIGSLTLGPGIYSVAALYEVGHTDPVVFGAAGTFSNHPGVAVHGAQFTYGGVLQFPSGSGVGWDDRYFGSAVRIAHAPEPGTLALLGVGVLGLGFARSAARRGVSEPGPTSFRAGAGASSASSPASSPVTGPAGGGTLAARRPS